MAGCATIGLKGANAMRTALYTKEIVQSGGVIEIRAPQLVPGSIADVVIWLESPVNHADAMRKQPDPVLDLGWPPGFFERTFGSLRDSQIVRGDQGQYEIRDEIV
jgi:hypothetical protein